MLGEKTKNKRTGLAILLAALVFGSVGIQSQGKTEGGGQHEAQAIQFVDSGVSGGSQGNAEQEGSAPGAEQQQLQTNIPGSSGYRDVPTLSGIRLKDSFQTASFTLSLESAIEQDLSIEIYDLTGAKILCRTQSLDQGENTFAFNKEHISPGIYYLRASVRDMEVTKKFMN